MQHPIFKAILDGNFDLVKKLVEEDKLCVNVTDETGWTPLHYAAYKGHCFIAEFLIQNGSGMYLLADNRTPLEMVIYYNHSDLINIFIENGYSVNGCSINGRTLLHMSCMRDNLEAFEKLIELGADPTMNNNKGEYAFQCASDDLKDQMFDIMVRHGCISPKYISGNSTKAAKPQS